MEENKKIFNQEDFLSDIQAIDAEVSDVDSLYNEIKKHFDGIKNSQFKGSLSFIEKQTTNLVALKKAKLDLLNSKFNLKIKLVDTELKEKQINIKESSANDNEFLAEELLKKLNKYSVPSNDDEESISSDNEDIEIENNYEDELEARTKDLNINIDSILDTTKPDLTKLNNDKKENNSSENESNDNIDIVYDEDSKVFISVDSDFNIIEELGKNYDKIENEPIILDGDRYVKSKSSDKLYLVVGLE